MSYLQELIDYVAFGDDDHARLRALHPLIAPHFPAIADRFYEAVWANPGAAAMLTSPAQVERLRLTLIDWMSTGLLGPYDDAFYERRSRIGQRHVQIGLAHQYMFAAMTVVRLAYHGHIVRLCGDGAQGTIDAVDKLLDLELAIVVHNYQLDSERRLVAAERKTLTDRMTAMQTLTAGIAHEVRNPLNSAKLQLELLVRRLRKRDDTAPLVGPAALAQSEIARLTTLLDDFLAFARPPELHLHNHDVVEILERVVELERIGASMRGIELVLARTPPQLLARIDAPKVHQIVLNLARNAIEAVGRGGHVELALASDDARFTITVRDDGPGIPDTVRERIFEPFFSTKETGTGLGMAIVHSLVALHGGTIDLATSPAGTRFDVTIPRQVRDGS